MTKSFHNHPDECGLLRTWPFHKCHSLSNRSLSSLTHIPSTSILLLLQHIRPCLSNPFKTCPTTTKERTTNKQPVLCGCDKIKCWHPKHRTYKQRKELNTFSLHVSDLRNILLKHETCFKLTSSCVHSFLSFIQR